MSQPAVRSLETAPSLPNSASASSLLAQSASSCASSTSPVTPATPWTDDLTPSSDSASKEERGVGKGGRGLGLGVADSQGQTKLTGRGALSKARVEAEDDEQRDIDAELEDELNDFGYGSRVKRRDQKESLLDMLNSEPPAWMVEAEPVPVSLPNRKSSTLPSKIRRKFSASPIDSDVQAGFTTLQRGGSKSRQQDTLQLRSSRSAGNLLSSFRTRTNNFGFKMPGGGGNRSQEDTKGSVDLGNRANPAKPSSKAILDDDEFERLINASSGTATTKRLTAKDPLSTSSSTRDLADFLQSPGKLNRSTLDKSHSSISLASERSSPASAGSNNGGSITLYATPPREAGGGNDSIVRTAMSKLGAARRRASIGTAASFSQLTSPRPATSSGIPRLSPTRLRFKRPSTAQTVASDESAYDPQNKETIQIDETLMRGMFGQSTGLDEQEKQAPDARERGAEKERLEESLKPLRIGGSSPALGVYEFVEVDERESGGRSPELYRLGSLTKSKSVVNVSTVRRVPAGSPTSFNSIPTKLPSPRRKPVPLPATAGDSSQHAATRSPHNRDNPASSSSNLGPLQDDGDSAPPAMAQTPFDPHQALDASTKGRSMMPVLSNVPFSSLIPAASDVATPTTPYDSYSTRPLTPAADSAAATTSLLGAKVDPDRRPSTSPDLHDCAISISSPLATPPRNSSPRPASPTLDRPASFSPRPMVLKAREINVSRNVPSPVNDHHHDGNERLKLDDDGGDDKDGPARAADPGETRSRTFLAAAHASAAETDNDDAVILAALGAVKSAMDATVNLPVKRLRLRLQRRDDDSDDDDDDDEETESLLEFVPTLRSLQESMELGAKLLDAILARVERKARDRTGRRAGSQRGEEVASSGFPIDTQEDRAGLTRAGGAMMLESTYGKA